MPVNRIEKGTNNIYQIVIFELTPISKKVVVNGPPLPWFHMHCSSVRHPVTHREAVVRLATLDQYSTE